jgi:hypothetical protein
MHDETWRIAPQGPDAWISAQIDCALAEIAFAQAYPLIEKVAA